MSDECATDAMPSPPRDNINNKTYRKDCDTKNDENEEFVQKPQEEPADLKQETSSKATVIQIYQSTGIHIGNVNYNNFGSNNSVSNKCKPVKAKEIKRLLNNKEQVTIKDIIVISNHLGVKWKKLARELKYTDGQMDIFEHKAQLDLKETIIQFLRDWIQNEPEEAYVAKLADMLWDLDFYEALAKWLEEFDSIHKS